MPKTLDIETFIDADGEALEIARFWREWNIFRQVKVEEWKELRNYLFATTTLTTSNKALPWSNSTTTPKLTQIRDNIHANYFAALFPNNQWMKWKANDEKSNKRAKREVIQSYVSTKVEQSKAVDTHSRLLLDWIDTGNAFAYVEHVVDFVDLGGPDKVTNYVGPKIKRISPYDIAFNPVVDSFDDTPKIIKELVTMGDVKRLIEQDITNSWMQEAFDKMISVRGTVNAQDSEVSKGDGYVADGFSSINNYYRSGAVELLHFFGDIYNHSTGELQLNRIVTVADRSRVIRNVVNPSWLGAKMIRHIGWRQRPDNLYAMGPLDNLVGLQYRMDHLENMKADVWDQIAYPRMIIRGDVQEFGDDLGERIYLGDEGQVAFLAPDGTALNADQQIADLANKMEELAGAPRSAMGIRTPGEKTAFEVGVIDRGGNRVFVHKASHYERNFLEPLLNDMLEVGRRNLDESDLVRMLDPDTGVALFKTITREDITARGVIVPTGSRHFAERALRLQNLQQLQAIRAQDPSIGVHMSGKEMARILSDELDEPTLYRDNVGVFEQMETQKLVEESQVQAEEETQLAIEQGI